MRRNKNGLGSILGMFRAVLLAFEIRDEPEQIAAPHNRRGEESEFETLQPVKRLSPKLLGGTRQFFVVLRLVILQANNAFGRSQSRVSQYWSYVFGFEDNGSV
jgi:hypothetical protein